MTGSEIPVIVNARAGTAAATGISADDLRELFGRAKMHAEVLEAKNGSELAQFARAAVARKPRMIVAGGGDGTINAVAAHVAGTGIPLGVLPLGTLNHFARDLGMPSDIEAAVRALAMGHTVPVDVGEVNGRVFLNNSSIGLYPSLVDHRDREQQRLGLGKWSALLRATLTVLHRYPLLSVRVRCGDQQFVRRTPLVFVGNNAYAMEGLDIGRRERIDAGTLSLYIPRRQGRFALFRIAFRALFGRLRAVDDFDSMQAPEISIETRRHHVRVATDGEVASVATPLHYSIRVGALRVIVPTAPDGPAREP
ncbi:MAG: diacylglycerol kinase family protein [Casimicrobiaceae bacterium]